MKSVKFENKELMQVNYEAYKEDQIKRNLHMKHLDQLRRHNKNWTCLIEDIKPIKK